MSNKILKATHTGILDIVGKKIPCAVLEDGQRVLSEHGITTALGSRSGAAKRLKRAGKEGGAPLPVFIASKNLLPYINNDLYVGLTDPLEYIVSKDRNASGFPAELLPQICDVWLKAREDGALNKQQYKKCLQAEMLMRGLAHIGIIALVDEATGYQVIRDKLALQAILDKYLRKELAAWAKRFPDEFYIQMFRLRDWQWRGMKVNRPSVVGKYTKDIVYERLAPNILEELEKRNPRDSKGQRKHKHHQWLTEDIGHPALSQHLYAVIALMKSSSTWDQFHRSLQRALPKKGQTIEMPLEEETT